MAEERKEEFSSEWLVVCLSNCGIRSRACFTLMAQDQGELNNEGETLLVVTLNADKVTAFAVAVKVGERNFLDRGGLDFGKICKSHDALVVLISERDDVVGLLQDDLVGGPDRFRKKFDGGCGSLGSKCGSVDERDVLLGDIEGEFRELPVGVLLRASEFDGHTEVFFGISTDGVDDLGNVVRVYGLLKSRSVLDDRNESKAENGHVGIPVQQAIFLSKLFAGLDDGGIGKFFANSNFTERLGSSQSRGRVDVGVHVGDVDETSGVLFLGSPGEFSRGFDVELFEGIVDGGQASPRLAATRRKDVAGLVVILLHVDDDVHRTDGFQDRIVVSRRVEGRGELAEIETHLQVSRIELVAAIRSANPSALRSEFVAQVRTEKTVRRSEYRHADARDRVPRPEALLHPRRQIDICPDLMLSAQPHAALHTLS